MDALRVSRRSGVPAGRNSSRPALLASSRSGLGVVQLFYCLKNESLLHLYERSQSSERFEAGLSVILGGLLGWHLLASPCCSQE